MLIQLVVKFDAALDKVVKGLTVETTQVEFIHFDHEKNEIAVGMKSGLVNKLPLYAAGLPSTPDSTNNYDTLMLWIPVKQ